jgi:ParB family chromosome partitioning protein
MSKSLTTIPLCQLQRSKINVRKTDRTAGIEELAASIEAHGLLENLVVSPFGNTKGADAIYDVVAGGRRHAALKLLAKRRKIASDFPVPCQVRKPNGSGLAELSLAENVERLALHPADQFEAFARLQSEGQSAGDIAARFGLTQTLVVQRLKLAVVSPKLMAEYRKDVMTLEQLMAFTLSDDHVLQEEVWFDTGYAGMPPQEIRRHLTKAQVDGNDRRARFVGTEAYEAAGGSIVRDLFDEGDEGYFSDSQLLDRIVTIKLGVEAQIVRQEGWKWVETAVETNYVQLAQFGRIKTIEKSLSAKDEKRLVRLGEKYEALVAALDEEEDPDKVNELDRVSANLETLQNKKEGWAAEDKARSGALLCLDHDGTLKVHRGLIKADDRRTGEADAGQESIGPRKTKRSGEYPDSLLADLSAHRTAALREVLASQPEHALTALLQTLVERLFHGAYQLGCIGIMPTFPELERHSKSVGESKAALSFLDRHTQWQKRLPERDTLWDWLSALGGPDRLALLAHCISATLDAVWRRDAAQEKRHEADRLAQVLSLDMAEWWRPTRANFLHAVSKDRIVQAVTEGFSVVEGGHITSLKKADMAERAEAVLAATPWLPEPLQTPSVDALRET